jgi:hypothetical protein
MLQQHNSHTSAFTVLSFKFGYLLRVVPQLVLPYVSAVHKPLIAPQALALFLAKVTQLVLLQVLGALIELIASGNVALEIGNASVRHYVHIQVVSVEKPPVAVNAHKLEWVFRSVDLPTVRLQAQFILKNGSAYVASDVVYFVRELVRLQIRFVDKCSRTDAACERLTSVVNVVLVVSQNLRVCEFLIANVALVNFLFLIGQVRALVIG